MSSSPDSGVPMSGSAGPAVPLPSATVVLVRPGEAQPEVLLVRRPAATSFGATYVFPGGVVEAADRDAHVHCAGERAARAEACLDLPGTALDYYSAAIRELFEETGVLLARTAGGDWALNASTATAYDRDRRALNDGRTGWADLLAQRQLSLVCDSLHYFAHWITPVRTRKRFTTRFFLAALPEGQRARHEAPELTDSCWMSADAALAAADGSGSFALPRPTRITLAELVERDSVEELLDWAARREAGGVAACMPAIIGPPGEERIVMPGDPHYPPGGGEAS